MMMMMMMMISYQHIIDKIVIVLAEFFIRLVAITVDIVFMYVFLQPVNSVIEDLMEEQNIHCLMEGQ